MSDLRTLNTTDWGHGTDLATRNRVLRNTYWLLALSLLWMQGRATRHG